MKLIQEVVLLDSDDIMKTLIAENVYEAIRKGIRAACWPEKSDSFKLRPKRRGNGVKPIKAEVMASLREDGWQLEVPMDIATVSKPGKLDAVYATPVGPFAFEWETGNISSSHRALNKMALGLLNGVLAGGALVVPSRNMYPYLTDRVGNFAELEPYIPLWQALNCEHPGRLSIFVVEHDELDKEVALIPKGTDGRAKI